MSELLSLSHDQIMPLVESDGQSGWRAVAATGFHAWRWLVETLWTFMLVATALVVVRSLLLAVLAYRQKRQAKRIPSGPIGTWPAVSVLIAAYNEGKVIAETLRSILSSDYAGAIENIGGLEL